MVQPTPGPVQAAPVSRNGYISLQPVPIDWLAAIPCEVTSRARVSKQRQIVFMCFLCSPTAP